MWPEKQPRRGWAPGQSWGSHRLFRCLLQKQGREKRWGPIKSFQKSRDSTASLYGVDPLEIQELRGSRGCAPQPAFKSSKAYPDQSKEGISLPTPIPFPNPGGVIRSNLLTAPAWRGESFDIESNSKWGLLSGTKLSNFGIETRFRPENGFF